MAVIPTWVVPAHRDVADCHRMVVQLTDVTGSHDALGQVAALGWVVGLRPAPLTQREERLNIADDEESVLCRENVFWADADPMQRVTTWIPWPIAEGTGLLQDVVPHPYGIHGVLEDQGHRMARIQEDVSARMPTPDERDRLALPPGVPVLDVLHTSVDQDGKAYELTLFVLRADLSGLRYDVPVE